MLKKHKKSKLTNTLGAALCLVLAVFTLTKAPVTIANEYNSDTLPTIYLPPPSGGRSWSFKLVDTSLVEFAIDLSKGLNRDYIGLELLVQKDSTISLILENVSAYAALTFILECHDLSFKLTNEKIVLFEKKSRKSSGEQCLSLKSG